MILGNQYDQYVQNLSLAFSQALARTETAYNFDHGDEFEVALGETLQECLPGKYGVCRGMVVSPQGEEAGDDIIIYDRMTYPVLRTKREGFALKQRIPIEAVYAYIEAKNCRTVGVDDADEQSITRAVSQVARVRKLVESRSPVLASIVPSDHHQTIKNPFFGAVMSKGVKGKTGEALLGDATEVLRAMTLHDSPMPSGADFIALGQDLAFIPVIDTKWEIMYVTPFARPGSQQFRFEPIGTGGNSFGLFFASLMSAIGSIELGPFPWQSIVGGFFVRHYFNSPAKAVEE